MPRLLYSYKFKREVPLLSEEEYEPISDLLYGPYRDLKKLTQEQRDNFDRAEFDKEMDIAKAKGLSIYARLTGVQLEDPDMLYHVNISQYGRLCPECSKPFRTPEAHFCAVCAYELPEGEVAGPCE